MNSHQAIENIEFPTIALSKLSDELLATMNTYEYQPIVVENAGEQCAAIVSLGFLKAAIDAIAIATRPQSFDLNNPPDGLMEAILEGLPTEEEFKRRNEAVNKGLALALRSLLTPGIVIEEKKDVPLYWVSKNEPDIFIRRLNGRDQRGRMIDSKFQVID